MVIPTYDDVSDFSEGLAAVEIDKKWGYIDKSGKIVISATYKDAMKFSEGLAGVRTKEGWGFINKSGELVIKHRYKEIREFKDGIAAVNKDGFWGAIDSEGKQAIPFEYDDVRSLSEGLAVAVKGEYVKDAGQIYLVGEDHFFLNKYGKAVISMFEKNIGDFSEGLAAVEEKGKWGYIDRNKKVGGVPVKYDSAMTFSEGLAAVEIKYRWGYIDHAGKQVIPMDYMRAGSFSEGLASVNHKGKWGFINHSNQFVVECKYDSAAHFSEGLALVKKTKKVGFINQDAEEIIPMKYHDARTFNDGVAAVKYNGKWGFITLNYMRPGYIEGKLMTEEQGKSVPLANASVSLSNGDESTKTGNDGVFKLLTNGYGDELTLGVVTDKAASKVTLYTVGDEKVGELENKEENSFEYRYLPMTFSKMKVLEEEDVELSFKGKILTEVKGKKVPVANAVVKFSHDADSAITDENGDFKLRAESHINVATLQVRHEDKKIKEVIVASSTGEEIKVMSLLENGGFEYRFLPNEYAKMVVPEEEEVTPLFRGKILTEKAGAKVPVSNAKVQLSNSSDIAVTDEFGDFEIKSAGYEEGVKINVKSDAGLSNMILAKQSGEEIVTLTSIANGEFEYKFLPMEYSKLTTYEEEDVEMAFKNAGKSKELSVSQPIHYAFGKHELEASSYAILDKIVKIMNENPKVTLEIISHTDATGSASYNMELSVLRAETVLNYLVASGIKKKRLTPIGKGETEIRNRCVDGVECSDAEHEYNRHTEFKFIME